MKMKLSETGRKILWKAVRTIEQNPKTFMMEEWIRHNPRIKGKNPLCGTVACIGGHVVLQVLKQAPEDFAEFETPKKYQRALGTYTDTSDLAAEILGIDPIPAMNLFEEFYHQGKKITPKNVRARVKEWLKTGE